MNAIHRTSLLVFLLIGAPLALLAQDAEITRTYTVNADGGDGQTIVVEVDASQVHERNPDADPYIGIVVDNVSRGLARHLNLSPDVGLVIESVVNNSPASEAGLEEYDILVAYNDQIIVGPMQLGILTAITGVGNVADLTVLRGGEEVVVPVTIADRHAGGKQSWRQRLFGTSSGSASVPGAPPAPPSPPIPGLPDNLRLVQTGDGEEVYVVDIRELGTSVEDLQTRLALMREEGGLNVNEIVSWASDLQTSVMHIDAGRIEHKSGDLTVSMERVPNEEGLWQIVATEDDAVIYEGAVLKDDFHALPDPVRDVAERITSQQDIDFTIEVGDGDFEMRMENFSVQMEEFSENMEAWGERMEAWSERFEEDVEEATSGSSGNEG